MSENECIFTKKELSRMMEEPRIKLTPRQRDIIQCYASGSVFDEQIAEMLKISRHTVRAHWKLIARNFKDGDKFSIFLMIVRAIRKRDDIFNSEELSWLAKKFNLSQRLIGVLQCLCRGMFDKQIARELGMTTREVQIDLTMMGEKIVEGKIIGGKKRKDIILLELLRVVRKRNKEI